MKADEVRLEEFLANRALLESLKIERNQDKWFSIFIQDEIKDLSNEFWRIEDKNKK